MSRLTDFIVMRYEKNPLLFIVLAIPLTMLAVTILLALFTNGNALYFAMFPDKNDIFMDYFSSMYYSMHNPYTEHSVIYPPLITVIYQFLGNITMYPEVVDSPMGLRASYTGMFYFFMLSMISIFAMSLIIRRRLETTLDKRTMILVLIALLFSYPLIFAMMRGNCILFALIFVCLFLFGYRSENMTIRYLSYVCLGIATGLKIYMVFFGLLVLRERNVRDIIVCVVIGVLLFMVPFFFTDGDIVLFLKNSFGYTTGNTGGVSAIINLHDLVSPLYGAIGTTAANVIYYLAVALVYLCTAYIVIFRKDVEMWKLLFLISAITIIGFGTSAAYAFLVYLIPAIAFLRDERNATKANIAIAIALGIILMVFPGFFNSDMRNFFISLKGIVGMIAFLLVTYVILSKKRTEDTEVSEI